MAKKYLKFQEVPYRGRKTRWFRVYDISGCNLGYISWYVPWRQYCFTPKGGCVWSTTCDKQKIEFIEQLNAEHKQLCKARENP